MSNNIFVTEIEAELRRRLYTVTEDRDWWKKQAEQLSRTNESLRAQLAAKAHDAVKANR